jgi:hypothetical protein
MINSLLLLLALPLLSAPHPSKCLTVELRKVDAKHYEFTGENKCGQGLPLAVVAIKFFNKKWERIGVSTFSAASIAPHEKFRKTFPAPEDVSGFEYVGVRAITDSALDELR